jgi:hypothetical protein
VVDIVDAPAATDIYAVQPPASAVEDERADWLATVRTPELAILFLNALETIQGRPEGMTFELREP